MERLARVIQQKSTTRKTLLARLLGPNPIMTKKKNKDDKRLSAQALQIEILKFLLAHPKKNFSARQITQHLRVDNNRDSATHALQQLVQLGTVTALDEDRFSLALDRLTTRSSGNEDDSDTQPTLQTPSAPRAPRIEKYQGDERPNPRLKATPPTRSPRKMIEGRRGYDSYRRCLHRQ